MGYFAAFAIGTILVSLQMTYLWVRKPVPMDHPYQGFGVAVVAGGFFYGTVIWIIALAF